MKYKDKISKISLISIISITLLFTICQLLNSKNETKVYKTTLEMQSKASGCTDDKCLKNLLNLKFDKNEIQLSVDIEQKYIDYYVNYVTYKQKDFNKFKHGYIISIHKSQGSEFELVIMPVSSSYKRMLYKKLIYTAVTRAKKRLIIIGEPMAFMYGIRNNNEIVRKTNLLEKLLNNLNKR